MATGLPVARRATRGAQTWGCSLTSRPDGLRHFVGYSQTLHRQHMFRPVSTAAQRLETNFNQLSTSSRLAIPSQGILRHCYCHQQRRSISMITSTHSRHRLKHGTTTYACHASSQPQPPPPSNPTSPSTQPQQSSTLVQKLKSVTTTPHENIYTLPNILTFSRLLCAPAIGYFILTSQPLLALSLFFYAGITDLLDGYLARRLSQHTVVGTVIDPMADKTLMTICVVALGVTGQFPWWLVTIILGRDVALAISAIWWRWISLPPPKTMRRYWDFSLPSAEVHPTEISKINTLLQLLLVGNAMVLPVLPEALVQSGNLVGILEGWEMLVAATTVWSGLSYVGNKDAVKIIGREEREARER